MNETPPDVRFLIPCWKEPTMNGQRPSAHEIMYAVQPKQELNYPVWQRSYFVLVILANLHGLCPFHIEMRLADLDVESVIQRTNLFTVDFGNDPLRVQPISIMMNPVELHRPGVYELCFVWNGDTLAKTPIHAR